MLIFALCASDFNVVTIIIRARRMSLLALCAYVIVDLPFQPSTDLFVHCACHLSRSARVISVIVTIIIRARRMSLLALCAYVINVYGGHL